MIRALSYAYPVVFLSVAAFMVNAVLARLVRLQREQIAQLKALGYSSWQVGRHYLRYALVIVVLGTVTGGLVGRWFGGKLLSIYDLFIRFPALDFMMDPQGVRPNQPLHLTATASSMTQFNALLAVVLRKY